MHPFILLFSLVLYKIPVIKNISAFCNYFFPSSQVQCQLDNMTSAEEYFRAALRLSPHDWQSLTNYGVMLVRHVGDQVFICG